MQILTSGDGNTAVGYLVLVKTLTSGSNNTFIRSDKLNPHHLTVSNEVTIGNDNITSTRLER